MELVVQILMLFIVVGTAVRLSFERVWVSLLFGLAAAAFVYLTYPLAIEQTKTGLAGYIADRSLREYAAIFISLEVALLVGYSFSRLELPRTKRARLIALGLRLYPPLLPPVYAHLRPAGSRLRRSLSPSGCGQPSTARRPGLPHALSPP